MSSSNTNSRKRPMDAADASGDGNNGNNGSNNNNNRATQAQEYKRRQILQSEWGFKEVLTECGLLEFASGNSGDGNVDDADNNANDQLGCQLGSKTTPSGLGSSTHALLSEMSKNGIDPRNERVLGDMEELILGGGGGGGDDDNNGETEGGGGGSNALLRRMLLPLYRVRRVVAKGSNQGLSSQFSQFSQPDIGEDGNNSPNNNDDELGSTIIRTKTVVESSSLIKVLLRIEVLQSTLLSALLTKLPELAASNRDDDEVGGGNSAANHGGGDDDDIPRLIFSNLRWLDHIADYSSLTSAYVECLAVLATSSSSCARTRGILLDAISTLPDILSDCNALCGGMGGDDDDEGGDVDMESNPILSTLHHLRSEDPTLLIPVLDALGSLPLTDGQMVQVTRNALEALSNVETWGLPALISFLMNHCPSGTSGQGKEMVNEVIDEMRKLPLGNAGDEDDDDDAMDGMEVNGGRSGYNTRSGRRNNDPSTQSSSASAALMIEALSRGFAHRPDLSAALLRSVKETSASRGLGYHPPADIWLLATCASAPHNRTRVKSLFKSKAGSGMFTSRLIRESLSGNGVALTSLFGTSLCDLADGLLRASSSDAPGGTGAACELGVTLYEILFEEFQEPMQRQEVVGSLVTHVGSGVNVNTAEVDAALRVLCNIVDKNNSGSGQEKNGATALRAFKPFLTSMLEHIRRMTPSQVRRLFLLLFAVGYDSEEGGNEGVGMGAASGGALASGGADDVSIVISKHLALASFDMKRIGIIGAVANAVSRSSQLQERQAIIDGTEATCLPMAVASSPVVADVIKLLENAYDQCKPARASFPTSNISNNSSIANGLTTSSTVGGAFSDGKSAAFFLDELGHAVRGGRLATPIKEFIEEKIQQEFETTYVGDFEETEDESKPQKGTKGADTGPMLNDDMIPTNDADLAMLNGLSTNPLAPPGDLRFDIAGADSLVYVKILPLLASHDPSAREILPVQLAPMFRLLSTLSDQRFGGEGLSEIDAMLECPMLLPSSDCSGMEFEDLSPAKQLVTTASYFFASCWIRQLINSFIYAADVTASTAGTSAGSIGSFTAGSQGFNSEEVQKKLVARLEALVDLEEELRFTSSKCYAFAPPGFDILPPPKELFGSSACPIDDEENIVNVDPKSLSKEEKKELAAAKKRATKQAKDKVKSKQKRLKAKKVHEAKLMNRTMGALRQLDPQTCTALGFKELSVMGNSDDEGGSQALSQSIQQVTTCGGAVTTLLLNLLQKALSDSLSEKKGMAFRTRMGGNSSMEEDVDNDNPYMTKDETPNNATDFAIALAACEESSKKSFAMLDSFLRAGVFASLYEHLAAVAELRCGPNRKADDTEAESQLVETARCLFSCLETLMSSQMLTRSSTGKYFLASILKQIAVGDRNDYGSTNTKRRRPTAPAMKKLMHAIIDNVDEIVTGAYTGDLDFAMDGVNCINAIFECSKRISDEEKEAADDDFTTKLSEFSHKLLKQDWPDDVKLNKGNVGKLLSLFVEHSKNRMDTLTNLVNDVLEEIPHLEKGQGVAAMPTASHQTFGSYYSTVMEYICKELVNLFSLQGKSKDPAVASGVLERMRSLIGLLQTLFNLTKNNDSLAKKAILLQQLKFGSRFIETFVSKAVPFFQVHFQHHEDSILDVIRDLQKCSKQLHHIISHGKRAKDAGLAKETPRAKKALEMFIHKVKAMLKKNQCMTAMGTKVLEERDVDGTKLKEESDESGDEDGDESDDANSDSENEDGSGEEDGSNAEAENSDDEYDTDDD